MIEHGILIPQGCGAKPYNLLMALFKGLDDAGESPVVLKHYRPCKLLWLYGWGGTEQQQAIKAHKGNYWCFDLGYWNRSPAKTRCWRVSLNGFHPQAYVMQGPLPPASRLGDRLVLPDRTEGPANAPVVLIGTAPKSVRVTGAQWGPRMAAQIRKQFPDRPLVYRPKPGRQAEAGIHADELSTGDLEDTLKSASLVVCRHSNVAVDACQLGVPVVTASGAAAAIYPQSLRDHRRQPTYSERMEFLQRLAWWQWTAAEARDGSFLRWARDTLNVPRGT